MQVALEIHPNLQEKTLLAQKYRVNQQSSSNIMNNTLIHLCRHLRAQS